MWFYFGCNNNNIKSKYAEITYIMILQLKFANEN